MAKEAYTWYLGVSQASAILVFTPGKILPESDTFHKWTPPDGSTNTRQLKLAVWSQNSDGNDESNYIRAASAWFRAQCAENGDDVVGHVIPAQHEDMQNMGVVMRTMSPDSWSLLAIFHWTSETVNRSLNKLSGFYRGDSNADVVIGKSG